MSSRQRTRQNNERTGGAIPRVAHCGVRLHTWEYGSEPGFVLGAQPLTAGWSRVLIQPHPRTPHEVEDRMPTPRGELSVHSARDKNFTLALTSIVRKTALACASREVSLRHHPGTTNPHWPGSDLLTYRVCGGRVPPLEGLVGSSTYRGKVPPRPWFP